VHDWTRCFLCPWGAIEGRRGKAENFFGEEEDCKVDEELGIPVHSRGGREPRGRLGDGNRHDI
jgi:hypothetical protein